MDETNINDNQYANVDETINQGNVAAGDAAAGDVAAGDAAAALSEAGLGTATDTAGVNPGAQNSAFTEPFVTESEKQKGQDDLLNLIANQGIAAIFWSSTEFHAHKNIDPEDTSTVPDEI